MKHLKEYLFETINDKNVLIQNWINKHLTNPDKAVINNGRIDAHSNWSEIDFKNIKDETDFPDYIKFGDVDIFYLSSIIVPYIKQNQYPEFAKYFYVKDSDKKINKFVANTNELTLDSWFENANNIEGIYIKSKTNKCTINPFKKFKLKDFEKIHTDKKTQITLNLGWDVLSIDAGKELIKKYNDFLKKKIKTYETTNYDDYKNELSDFIKSLFPTIENIEKIIIDNGYIFQCENINGQNVLVLLEHSGINSFKHLDKLFML